MAIQGIPGAGHQVTAARAAYAVAAVNRRPGRSAAPALAADADATSVRISSSAELLGKLRLLHDAQPKDFKRLMGELATDVQGQAEAATGEQAQQLTQIGERFAEAAREGNLTPLVPAIASGRTRAQYAPAQDALVAPSDAARELFGTFVDKVNAVLAPGTGSKVTKDAR